MGIGNKADNKGEKLGGKVKESTGKATGNERLEAEGKGDQSSAKLKDGAEKVKDAGKDIKDGLTGGSKNKP